MQNSQLDRLLKLAKRTGDRLIVTSNHGAEPVVILPLAEDEGMLDAMTVFREGARDGGVVNPTFDKDRDNEGGFAQDVQESAVDIDSDDGFDPVALERQVM